MIEKLKYQWNHGTISLDYALFLFGGFVTLLSLIPPLLGGMTYFGLGVLTSGLIAFYTFRLQARNNEDTNKQG